MYRVLPTPDPCHAEHAKEKILLFFLKTSVPRILAAEREAKKEKEQLNDKSHIAGNDNGLG